MPNAAMSSSVKYILDADVLIAYAKSPAFLNWVVAQNNVGVVIAIEAVGSELRNKPIRQFKGRYGKKLFPPLDGKAESNLAMIRDWLNNESGYPVKSIIRFLRGSDLPLIAQAMACQCAVVTWEVSDDTPSKKVLQRIKIPDVCDTFGVACMNPLDMLKAEGEIALMNQLKLLRSQ